EAVLGRTGTSKASTPAFAMSCSTARIFYMTERDGPMTSKAFHALFGRIGARAKMQFPIHPHMLRHGCGYAPARLGSATRTSSTPCATLRGCPLFALQASQRVYLVTLHRMDTRYSRVRTEEFTVAGADRPPLRFSTIFCPYFEPTSELSILSSLVSTERLVHGQPWPEVSRPGWPQRGSSGP